jgi:hypothetical protein
MCKILRFLNVVYAQVVESKLRLFGHQPAKEDGRSSSPMCAAIG